MGKTKRKVPPNDFVSGEVLKEIILCRPLRLFIKKQQKKGNQGNGIALRSEFLQLSTEKQTKYFQKAINKYIQLLDEKDINEHAQVEGHLLDNVLSKREQKIYFQSLDAPTQPFHTAAAYYTEAKKQENDDDPKAWKLLTADEKKAYVQQFNDAKTGYSVQVKNFAENLPERIKSEYLLFAKQTHTTPHVNGDNDDNNTNLAPIVQRRKSAQSLPESIKTTTTSDNQQKLTRTQLDDLHKCKPNVLYYEKKIPDDEKPTFQNTTAKNAYIRSLFNQLSEKKKHKFILKSIAKWEEYLQLNPTISELEIPTLHLLLGKNDEILFYFSSLGLPSRPPVSALLLYNQERQQTNSQQNWADLSQTTKDEYIKRLTKLKNEYHQKFIEFVEKILPSDYIRLEFFRNVKHAPKEYESFTKDRVHDTEEGQLKITQYLKPKKKETIDVNEFDRIKQQLLSTELNNLQRKLVHRLGQLMNKHLEETTVSNKKSSSSKSSTGATTTNPSSSKRQSIDSTDAIIINGEVSSDNAEHLVESGTKKKKKHKRDRSEDQETSTTKTNNDKEKQTLSSSSTKKRK